MGCIHVLIVEIVSQTNGQSRLVEKESPWAPKAPQPWGFVCSIWSKIKVWMVLRLVCQENIMEIVKRLCATSSVGKQIEKDDL